jgi:hypothetical protein
MLGFPSAAHATTASAASHRPREPIAAPRRPSQPRRLPSGRSPAANHEAAMKQGPSKNPGSGFVAMANPAQMPASNQ